MPVTLAAGQSGTRRARTRSLGRPGPLKRLIRPMFPAIDRSGPKRLITPKRTTITTRRLIADVKARPARIRPKITRNTFRGALGLGRADQEDLWACDSDPDCNRSS